MQHRIAVRIKDDLLRRALVEQIDDTADLETDGDGMARPPDLVVSDSPVDAGCASLILGAPPASPRDGEEYIQLPVRLSSLLARIRERLRKKSKTADYQIGAALLIPSQRTLLDADGQAYVLTAKQSDMLACLCESDGRRVSRANLLISIWNYPPDRKTHTVETHASQLRTILRRADAGVHLEYENGSYRLAPIQDSGEDSS